MGRNNQQRRAAKAKAKARSSQGGSAGGGGPAGHAFFSGGQPAGAGRGAASSTRDLETVGAWLGRALDALDGSRGAEAEYSSTQIVALTEQPAGLRAVSTVLTDVLLSEVERAWRLGWQPADLHRLVGRRLDGDTQVVVADAVAAQLSRYAPSTVAPRWSGQLSEIGASVWWPRSTGPIAARALDDGWGAVVPRVVRLLDVLGRLPRLEVHDPLPGTVRRQPREAVPAADERILARVRALLAKAESTTFEAEAETFTAGAQSLMSRHSIDAAMLAALGPSGPAGTTGGTPQGRRIGIDRPYESSKVLLLDVVGHANRCRSIWSKDLGFVTLVGFESDLDASETIFTSLLVQAGHAMQAQGARTTRLGQSRTRSFRQSFLMAYAHRIGERLRSVTDEETDAAVSRATSRRVTGSELVRVLHQRAAVVDEAMSAMFPEMVQRAVGSASDAEGWHAGRLAADDATLSGADASLGRSPGGA